MYLTNKTGCRQYNSWGNHGFYIFVITLYSLYSIKHTSGLSPSHLPALLVDFSLQIAVCAACSSYTHFQIKKSISACGVLLGGRIFFLRSFPALDVTEPFTGQEEETTVIGSDHSLVWNRDWRMNHLFHYTLLFDNHKCLVK